MNRLWFRRQFDLALFVIIGSFWLQQVWSACLLLA